MARDSTLPDIDLPDPVDTAAAYQSDIDKGLAANNFTSKGEAFGKVLARSFNGGMDPATAKAAQEQGAVKETLANLAPQGDSESDLDYQIRQAHAMYHTVAPLDTNMATKVLDRIVLLGQAKDQQANLREQQKDREAVRSETAMNRGSFVVGSPDGATQYGSFDVLKPDGSFDKDAYNAMQQAQQNNPNAVRQTQEQWAANKMRLAGEQWQMKLSLATLKAQQTADNLDPDTLDLAATDVLATPEHMRNYASFGQAGQGRRDQINGAIASKLKALNLNTSDLAGFRAEVKANATSIGKLIPQLQQLNVNETLAKNNGDKIIELASQVNPSQWSDINALAQYAKSHTGDEKAATYLSVVRTFQTEAARIIAGNPNGTGVLSDSARHELQDIVDGKLAPASLKSVIQRLYVEFDVKKGAIRDSIQQNAGAMSAGNTLQGIPGLNGTGASAGAGVTSPAPAMTIPSGVTFTTSH